MRCGCIDDADARLVDRTLFIQHSLIIRRFYIFALRKRDSQHRHGMLKSRWAPQDGDEAAKAVAGESTAAESAV